MVRLAAGILLLLVSATARAQFSTVINVPPESAPRTVPADTQVNVYPGGSFGGRFNRALDRSEVNFFGGGSGLVFQAENGSTVNIVDGLIGFGFQATSGSTVSVSGGMIEYGFTADAGSMVDISGGTFAEFIDIRQGSSVTLRGGDFQIDGVPIPGLDEPGAMAALTLPTGAIFTGVFADGTPFAFTSLNGDVLAEGAVTLEAATLPTAPPGVIVASVAGVPRGVRAGQVLIVDDGMDGMTVGDSFNVAAGGTIELHPGGRVLDELEAVDARVRVVGGTIATKLDLFSGSLLEMTAGQIGSLANVYDGSVMNLHGGAVINVRVHDGGNLNVDGGDAGFVTTAAGGVITLQGGTARLNLDPDSAVYFMGSDFRVDGTPVDLSDPSGVAINVPLGSNLSGVLASGDPIIVNHDSQQKLPNGVVTLVHQSPPPITQQLWVTSKHGPLRGIRQGQRIVVDSLGGMPQSSAAFYADGVEVRLGGTVLNLFEAIGTPVLLDGGSLGSSFALFEDTRLTIRSGTAGTSGRAYRGSRILMTGGKLGSTLRILPGASGHFSGGEIGGLLVSGDVVITGGVLGVGFRINDGGRIYLTGGLLPADTSTPPDFDAFAGSEVHLYGTDFLLNGQPISGLSYGIPKTITQRARNLSGHLLDGSPFVLGLHTTNEGGGCCVAYDYFDPAALLTITLLAKGDYNRDQLIDEADYALWRAEFGLSGVSPGDGADGNFDGLIDAADFVIWRKAYSVTHPGLAVSVPEPPTSALLSGAAGLIYWLPRDRRLLRVFRSR